MPNNNRNNKNTNKRRRNQIRSRRNTNTIKLSSGNIVTRDNPRFPNDVKMVPIHNRVIRYVSGASATEVGITPGNILKSIGMVTNASTTYAPILGCVRIRRVSLYFVPSSGDFGDTSNEISFRWTGFQNAPVNLITDRGTAYMPACIKVQPPTNSVASMWFDSNSTSVDDSLFVFSAPAKTVLDVDFDFCLANGTAPTAFNLSAPSSINGIAIVALAWGSAQLTPDGVTLYHE